VQGRGVEEKGVDKSTDKVLIEVDPPYFRSTEVDALVGDASKAGAKWIAGDIRNQESPPEGFESRFTPARS
jgi:GDP-D-mannose dehydratase